MAYRNGYGREHVLLAAERIHNTERKDTPSMGADKAEQLAGTVLTAAVDMGLIQRGPTGDDYDVRERRRAMQRHLAYGAAFGFLFAMLCLLIVLKA